MLPSYGTKGTVYDVQGLSGLTSLTYLQIPNNIKDMSPLQNLTQLKTLCIEQYGDPQETISLEALRNMTELTDLRIGGWGDDLSVDLSPLAGLTKLRALSIRFENSGSQSDPASVTNLSALENMKDLQTLELAVNNVTDISPLKELTSLRTLTLYNSGAYQITDWSPVDHVPNVTKG